MKTIKQILFLLLLVMIVQLPVFAQQLNQKIVNDYLTQIKAFEKTSKLMDLLPQVDRKTRNKIVNIEIYDMGGIVQSLVERWKNDQWENLMRITYSFDYDNRLAGYLTENWVENEWKNFQKNITTYNDDADPILMLMQIWENNDWENFHLDTLSYDDNHNVIENIGKNWEDTIWVNQSKIVMEYDDQNNDTTVIMQMWQDNNWVYVNKQVSTYNEKNLKTHWLSKIWMETEWMDQMETTYEYNENDLLVEEITKLNLFIDWKTSQIVKYEYNNNNQEIVRITKDLDIATGDTTSIKKLSSTYSGELLTEELTQIWESSNWVNTDLDTYTYENDQLTIVLWQKWKNNAWENFERWTHTYETVDVEDVEPLPQEFSLEQNYPNPFNPSTTIKYSITHPSIPSREGKERSDRGVLVTLKVYDMLGREVTTLVNEEQQPGNYQVIFNASSIGRRISSGVYYYRLSVGNNAMTKKCILLK